MRFKRMGRPIRPSPINPIFLGRRTGFKKSLLENGRRTTGPFLASDKQIIVTELRGGSSEAGIWVASQFSRSSQAVLGRWEKGRMPGAPPAEAAALRGLSSGLDTGGASGAAWGVSVAETPEAEEPELGFSSMRTRY